MPVKPCSACYTMAACPIRVVTLTATLVFKSIVIGMLSVGHA
jgi:hypothetical protein